MLPSLVPVVKRTKKVFTSGLHESKIVRIDGHLFKKYKVFCEPRQWLTQSSQHYYLFCNSASSL